MEGEKRKGLPQASQRFWIFLALFSCGFASVYLTVVPTNLLGWLWNNPDTVWKELLFVLVEFGGIMLLMVVSIFGGFAASVAAPPVPPSLLPNWKRLASVYLIAVAICVVLVDILIVLLTYLPITSTATLWQTNADSPLFMWGWITFCCLLMTVGFGLGLAFERKPEKVKVTYTE